MINTEVGNIFYRLDPSTRDTLDNFQTYLSNMNRSGSKLKWKSSDTLETYRANLTNPAYQKYKSYWLDESNAFTYNYNNYGFRTNDNFNNKELGVVTLGCSFTEGIGLPYELTWGYRIAQHLNVKHWNLGLAAMGLHTAYRVLLGAIQLGLKFNKIFLFVPPPFRYEFFIRDNKYVKKALGFEQDYLHTFINHDNNWFSTATQEQEKEFKFTRMLLEGDDSQSAFERVRMISAIAGLAKLTGKEFYYQDSTLHNSPVTIERAMSVSDDVCPNIPARDIHWHAKRQYNIYSNFVDELETNGTTKRGKLTKLL